ncbi:MAG: hypothetical protein KDA60_15810 [Planctomycetales bacterium]|nr:hypothetical protein [Planctomycetales bacterium]
MTHPTGTSGHRIGLANRMCRHIRGIVPVAVCGLLAIPCVAQEPELIPPGRRMVIHEVNPPTQSSPVVVAPAPHEGPFDINPIPYAAPATNDFVPSPVISQVGPVCLPPFSAGETVPSVASEMISPTPSLESTLAPGETIVATMVLNPYQSKIQELNQQINVGVQELLDIHRRKGPYQELAEATQSQLAKISELSAARSQLLEELRQQSAMTNDKLDKANEQLQTIQQTVTENAQQLDKIVQYDVQGEMTKVVRQVVQKVVTNQLKGVKKQLNGLTSRLDKLDKMAQQFHQSQGLNEGGVKHAEQLDKQARQLDELQQQIRQVNKSIKKIEQRLGDE